MKEVGLFYGTYTGVTGNVAKKIVQHLGEENVDLFNISTDGDKMKDYQNSSLALLLGVLVNFKKIGMLSCLNFKKWILQEKL